MTYDDAIKSGAMALFGEKYADKVRVLNFGDYSIELCGGTHVARTGDIGLFKIISESGVASGIRRIEAVTGMLAIKKLTSYKDIIDNASSLLKTSSDQVLTKIEQLLKQNRVLERELAATKQQILGGDSSDLTERVIQIGKINILIHRLDGLDAKSLRTAIDKLKSKLGSAIVILGSIHEDKVKLAVGVTKDLNNQISAGNLIKSIAEIVGGKGGGRPDFAQAGGPDKEKVDEALKLALKLIKDEL
jgi:alanyl-tRNA synthetase